jgi:hypothetical protein
MKIIRTFLHLAIIMIAILGLGYAMQQEAAESRSRHARGESITMAEVLQMEKDIIKENRALVRARTEWYKTHTKAEDPQ